MAVAGFASGAHAQAPALGPASDDWRTLRTEHFRVHFPPAAESLARAVAARVEPTRAEVARLVGHFPEQTVDVVIGTPLASASASGLPFREGARILLHATPPASARLEDFDDWISLSLGHELAHIAYLSRPPENKTLAYLARTLPITSLVQQLPAWVPEAYAASIADRLACAGRPRLRLHAALRNQLTAAGRLPDLDQLDGDTAWPHAGRREAVGTEFLRWLEARPRGSLPAVWRRMTAAAPRTFRAAIAAVFGASLEDLYDQWRRELEQRGHEGTASTGVPALPGISIDAMSAPDVGADGAVVVTLRRHDRRPRLAVLAADGEVRHFLDLEAADAAVEPRWLPDGSVLFVRAVAEGEDEEPGDLFRWWPESGRLERLSVGAVLRAVDVSPDGSWAVAVENRWGSGGLVRVAFDRVAFDRQPATVERLVAAEAGTILDAPRLSPDGARLAYLRHRGAGWRLVVRDLSSGAERELGDPALRVLAWPAWSPDGRWIVVTVADDESVRLEAWPTENAGDGGADRGRRLVSGSAAIAIAPAFDAARDEPALVHLELHAEGDRVVLVREAWSADAPGPPAPPPLAAANQSCNAPAAAGGEGGSYGRGPTTYSSLLGGGFSPSANHVVSGWRGGDVIGRWEAVAIASTAAGKSAESGGIVSGAWRGWRLPLRFHGYGVERRPSQQPEQVPGLGESLDLTERGFVLESGWRRERELRTLEVAAAVMAHKLTPRDAATIDRYALHLRSDADWVLELREATRLRLGTSLVGAAGWTDSAAWRRYGGELRAGVARALGRRIYALDGAWNALAVDDARLLHDRLALGGTPSSLVPQRYDLGRIYEAALPAGTRIGDRWESQRLSASHEGTRVRMFAARHRLSQSGAGHGDWLRLAGAELAADRDASPVFRLPSSSVRVGAGYVLDQPLRHQWMYWAGLAWTL